jgi:hypothetical protein
MLKLSPHIIATAVAACLLAGPAFAQSTAPATAPATKMAPATKTAPAKAKPERTAVSLECSKQADAKKLHGEERKKFRSACKKNGGKSS